VSEYSFTDRDGDTFTASHIGEGMMRLRAVYGAKDAERVDIDFLAADLDSIIRVMQRAAEVAAS